MTSADAISNILGGLTDAVVGACLGFLFGIILVRIQSQRKSVEYHISAIPILQIKPTDPNLSMSVDKSNLTTDPKDKGTFVPLVNAYVFEIDILNSGNEVILNPAIEITLDNNAKIVTHETEPSNRLGYEVLAEKDPVEQNSLIVKFPFINSNEIVSITVISTDNSNKDCTIDVLVPGIQQHTRYIPSPIIPLLFTSAALLTIFSFIVLPPTWMGGHAETVSVNYADGTSQTRTITIWPPYLVDMLNILAVFFLIMAFVTGVTMWYRYAKRWRRIPQGGPFAVLKVIRQVLFH